MTQSQPPGGATAGMTQPGASQRPRPLQAPVVKFKAALRKSKRRNFKEPEIDFLNITAMLDLMTIILVFVLKSLATSTTAIPQSEDLKLPVSIMTTEPGDVGVVIRISKTQITVGENADVVVTYPDTKQIGQKGLDARWKRNGQEDLYIQPLALMLDAYRETDKIARQTQGRDATTSDAIIVADETTPYRLLFEVLYTAGQCEFGRYHLLMRTGK